MSPGTSPKIVHRNARLQELTEDIKLLEREIAENDDMEVRRALLFLSGLLKDARKTIVRTSRRKA